MIGWRLILDLDLSAVEDAIEATWAKSAKMLGFAVRADAQASIRDGRGTSAPGTAPRSHDGTLRRWILYAYEKSSRSVVVGPKLLKRKSRDAAEALEHGGLSETTRGEVQRVRERPFMRPAMGRTIATDLARILTDSLIAKR